MRIVSSGVVVSTPSTRLADADKRMLSKGQLGAVPYGCCYINVLRLPQYCTEHVSALRWVGPLVSIKGPGLCASQLRNLRIFLPC